MDTHTETIRAALYARISLDESGQERGVTRQLEDARALAEARGWTVVGEYVDNDISAYSGTARPGYERLMADVQAGAFDRIVVYQTSRLWRGRRERAGAIDVLGKLQVAVAAVRGPELDLAHAGGRMVAGVLGEFDTYESEVKGERVARAALQRATEGRANGVCPYGWRRVYETDGRGQVTGFHDVEDEDAADIVRECVRRLLAGEGLRAIARDLEERDVPTPGGAAWRHGTVSKLVTRAANIGKRVHHGAIIGDAEWPPIIDEADHERVLAVLERNRRGRKASPFPTPERKWLLTYGVGECGECGSVLRVSRKRQKRKAGVKVYTLYVCDGAGCVGRSMEKVDELVGLVVADRLTRPDAASVFDHDPNAATTAADRADLLRERLTRAADRYAADEITDDQLATITAKLRPQIEEAERSARRANVRTIETPELDKLRAAGDPEAALAVWDGLDVDRQRGVLEVLGLRVRIMPTAQGPGFDPTDVAIEWEELR